jgi:hypothetical protein
MHRQIAIFRQHVYGSQILCDLTGYLGGERSGWVQDRPVHCAEPATRLGAV